MVLETSFWTVGYYAQVNQYLFDYFDIYTTSDIKDEILKPPAQFPSVIYPYAKLFQLLLDNNQFKIENPGNTMSVFGKADSSSILLASEQKLGLLINDNRPYQYAKNIGIPVVSVPGFILFLYKDKKITKNALLRKIEIIKPVTSQGLINNLLSCLKNIKPWEEK